MYREGIVYPPRTLCFTPDFVLICFPFLYCAFLLVCLSLFCALCPILPVCLWIVFVLCLVPNYVCMSLDCLCSVHCAQFCLYVSGLSLFCALCSILPVCHKYSMIKDGGHWYALLLAFPFFCIYFFCVFIYFIFLFNSDFSWLDSATRCLNKA